MPKRWSRSPPSSTTVAGNGRSRAIIFAAPPASDRGVLVAVADEKQLSVTMRANLAPDASDDASRRPLPVCSDLEVTAVAGATRSAGYCGSSVEGAEMSAFGQRQPW